MKKYIFISLLTVIIISCIGNKKNQTEKKIEKEDFPTFLVDFFPDTITYPYLHIINTDTTSQCIYYMVLEFSNKPPKGYLIKYNANDSNLITIKRETVLNWDKAKKKNYDKININNNIYYPIPYFEKPNIKEKNINIDELYSINTECGLSKGFDIYILSSEAGCFWDGLKPLEYMPNDWKNGYSKGISINEEMGVVIYWFIVW